jgi:hypothetical protein
LTVKLASVAPQAADWGFEAGCWALAARVMRRQAARQGRRRAGFMRFPFGHSYVARYVAVRRRMQVGWGKFLVGARARAEAESLGNDSTEARARTGAREEADSRRE